MIFRNQTFPLASQFFCLSINQTICLNIQSSISLYFARVIDWTATLPFSQIIQLREFQYIRISPTCLFRLSSLLTGIVCLSSSQSLFLIFLSIFVSDKTSSYSSSQIQMLLIIRKTLSLTNPISKNINDFPANE